MPPAIVSPVKRDPDDHPAFCWYAILAMLFLPFRVCLIGESDFRSVTNANKTTAAVAIVRINHRWGKVVLWPDTVIEKDINEMILSGKTKKEIKTIIDNNTYQGTTALMQFSMWRKVNV